MRRFLCLLSFALLPLSAQAWNAAGHRLVACIAWQQMSPASQQFVNDALSRHPDYPEWQLKAKEAEGCALLAEASTWPDEIRNDPRFYNEGREASTPALPGLSDTARHRHWHYVDLDPDGRAVQGEADRQIERLAQLLRSTGKNNDISMALPWLTHLVADIHQPLHVGRPGDDGGNAVEIENPYNKRLPFSSLHLYWDDRPGPPWLRGPRLDKRVNQLLADYPPPMQGKVTQWRDESHRLLDLAYPKNEGSLLIVIDADFHRQAGEIANRRIVDAGYRLGRLLEAIIRHRVPRETP